VANDSVKDAILQLYHPPLNAGADISVFSILKLRDLVRQFPQYNIQPFSASCWLLLPTRTHMPTLVAIHKPDMHAVCYISLRFDAAAFVQAQRVITHLRPKTETWSTKSSGGFQQENRLLLLIWGDIYETPTFERAGPN
jgi:hypothetical protein